MSNKITELSYILETKIEKQQTINNLQDTGIVLSISDGIARCYGLANVQAGEMVSFNKGNVKGMALNLEPNIVGIVIFGNDREIKEGDFVQKTGSIVSVPTGTALLGRVVDSLGNILDGKSPLKKVINKRVEIKVNLGSKKDVE